MPTKITPNRYIKTYYTLLKPIKSVTLSSYEKMGTDKISELRAASPKRLIELAKINCSIAKEIKENLDAKYGKRNYTLISIGRSVAALTESLQDMGVNTKFIPLSSMKGKVNYTDNAIKVFKKYLDSIGLTRYVLKNNPEHQFILFDYAATGEGLVNTKKLLEKENLIGEHQNLKILEVNSFVKYSWRKLFAIPCFKEFSPVGKLPNKNLENIFTQASTETAQEYKSDMAKIIRKLFRFNVLDCLKNNNFKIENPTLQFKALARYENPEYLKYIISQINWDALPNTHLSD